MSPPPTWPQRRRQEGLARPWSVLGDTPPCPDPALGPPVMVTLMLILPQITEIFSLGGSRLRDTAVWLPRCAPYCEGSGWVGGSGQMWAPSHESSQRLTWASER